MANTIDAKLRILADTAQALRELRALRAEIQNAKTGASQAAGGGADSDVVKQAQAAAKARIDAERSVAAAAKQADAEAVASAKAAAAEKAKADKAAAAEKAKADKAAAAAAATEARRQAREKAAADRAAAAQARKEASAQARIPGQLAPQITDIVTGLAMGQSPLTVALQQGGQINDTIGLGNALKALGQMLTVTRLAFGGLAAGVALFVTEVIAGARESDELRKRIALTGNAANITGEQLTSLSHDMETAGQATVGFSRELLTAISALPGQTDTTLKATASAAAAIAKLTGDSAEDAAKVFESQADGITEWSIKANKAYHFVTAAQVDHIRQLESEGRTTEAIRYANEELAKTLETRSVAALGLFERAWAKVKDRVSEFLEALKAVGRDTTPEERLRKLQAELDQARNLRRPEAKMWLIPGLSGREPQAVQQDIDTVNHDLLRGSERAADMRQQEEDIKKQTKAYQDSMLAIDAAGIQKRLAQDQAALDRKQSMIDLAHQQELISDAEHEQQLNEIERQRAAAQVNAIKGQIGIEKRRTVQTPEETNARDASVIQLEAQLVEAQSRLQQMAARGDQLLAADAERLAKITEEVWQRAFAKVTELQRQNAEAAAGRERDPATRARLEAEAQMAAMQEDLRRVKKELADELNRAYDPAVARKLQQQYDELKRASAQALDDLNKRTQFASFQKQLAEQTEALQIAEDRINRLVERGTISVEEGEQRKFAAREKALPQLRETLELLRKNATTEADENTIKHVIDQLDELGDKTTEIAKTLNSSLASGFTELFTDIETGSESALDAVRNFLAGVLKSALNIINQRLGEKLADSLIPKNGSQAGGGGWLETAASWLASLFHTGGVIGQGVRGAARAVSPALFQGAQVLHGGGMVLAPGEVPVIAKVGEEMLTEDDPRHRKNLSRSVGGVNVDMALTINGAGGTSQDQVAAAADLQQQMEMTVERWAQKQQRAGGILSGARRG